MWPLSMIDVTCDRHSRGYVLDHDHDATLKSGSGHMIDRCDQIPMSPHVGPACVNCLCIFSIVHDWHWFWRHCICAYTSMIVGRAEAGMHVKTWYK